MNELKTDYPLHPITAALVCWGINLQDALDATANATQLGQVDDERAITDAVALGWDGQKMDELLASWFGRKWVVLTVIAKESAQIGGLTLAQGQRLLDCLGVVRDDGKRDCGDPNFAHALTRVTFKADVPAHAQKAIREAAAASLELYKESA